jgi:hypothetical protein
MAKTALLILYLAISVSDIFAKQTGKMWGLNAISYAKWRKGNSSLIGMMMIGIQRIA